MSVETKKQRIIAGPCALESREHAQETITQARRLGIKTIRMNLWKPRTSPSFSGVESAGIPWLREAAEEGITPALEVLNEDQAREVIDAILSVPHATLLLWIGSRNQNHEIQQKIGAAVAGNDRVTLMIKNQPWRDEKHWKGIVEHVLVGGASLSQLLLCHRGFAPWDPSETELRNIPDIAMARHLRNELKLPLILDPSHIGGKKELVKSLIGNFSTLPDVDGQIIEVHPNPEQALTDAKQQLTWMELKILLEESQE